MADAYYAVAAPVAPAPADVAPRAASLRRALVLTAACVGIAAASRVLFRLAVGDGWAGPDEAIRYTFATTIGAYAAVSLVLLLAVRAPLRWRLTPWNVAGGAVLGGGLAYVVLRGNLTGGGHAGIADLVSGRSFAHIAGTVLFAVVAAPLCEEVLFRGVLMESLLSRGRPRVALWASAAAFAVWHLSGPGLLHYLLFGALFGGVYLRRGLAFSVATHAAFNAVLVLSAVAYAFAPGPALRVHDLVVTAPAGWAAGDDSFQRAYHGRVRVYVLPAGTRVDLHDTRAAVGAAGGMVGWVQVRHDAARVVRLPVGDALRVPLRHAGGDGELVVLSAGGRTYRLDMLGPGRAAGRADFDKMLRDLRVDS